MLGRHRIMQRQFQGVPVHPALDNAAGVAAPSRFGEVTHDRRRLDQPHRLDGKQFRIAGTNADPVEPPAGGERLIIPGRSPRR